MWFKPPIAVAVAILAALATADSTLDRRQSSLDAFVAAELPVAFNYALTNIGGTNGTRVPEADPGIVAASPSYVFPNYLYTWTRDSALTYAMIVNELIFGNKTLKKTIEDYTSAQAFLQTVSNPSGTLWPAGMGLGEMKFFLNETRFNEDWGRPQRDGPALRATVFIKLSNYLVGLNETDIAREVYWPLILNDLKYVGQYWNQTGYELWEEVHGTSFFTLNAQHRALTSGGLLAELIGEVCEPCDQAPEIVCLLGAFWNGTGGYITADVNRNQITTRSGINVSPLISSIQVFDIGANCDTPDFQPCNSKILSTHKVVVDSFRDLYPINDNKTAPAAVAVGRYPEDNYFDGNPWYLCTLACAEVLYDAAAQLTSIGSLTIDDISLDFFLDIYPNATEQTYTGDALTPIISALKTYADGFVEVVETYISPNGSISEQFNKTTGEPLSAYALTWSLASFVTTARARLGDYAPSWGANNATLPPATCSPGGYNSTGTYVPAYAAGAEAVDMECETEVLFYAYIDNNGTNPYLIGNNSLLGGAVNNKYALIQPMLPGHLNSTDNQWYVDMFLPAGVALNYQYVMIEPDGVLYFENTTHIVVPSKCGGGEVIVSDSPWFAGGVINGTNTTST